MKIWFYKSDCAGTEALDRLIGIFSYHSHVEGQFSDGTSFSASPRDGGCRFKDIDYNPDHWDCIDIPLHPDIEGKIRLECLKMKDLKYAYCGAVFSATPFCLSIPHRQFCSNLWTNLLRDYAHFPLKDGCKYTPTELYHAMRGDLTR